MRKIKFMLRKEFKQIFRNKQMLMIIFVLPIFQLFLIGFAVSSEVENVSLGIVDYDNSGLSRNIIDKFKQCDEFSYKYKLASIKEGEELIQNWNLQVMIVIPPNFSTNVKRGDNPEIGLFLDGLDGTVAGIAAGYASKILQDKAFELNAVKDGIPVKTRMWYNPGLKASQYMVPGLVAVLMTVVSMMLSSMNIVREKEIGTLEQLSVTSLKKYELLLGKLLPFLILSIISMIIMMQAAQLIFDITMQGSYLVLIVCSIVFLIVTLSLGTLVSTIASTQQQAMFISWFFMIFMILLSGLFVSVDNMPQTIRYLTLINPMSFFVNILRDVFQKGSGFYYLRYDLLGLGILGILMFVFSYLKFSKKTD